MTMQTVPEGWMFVGASLWKGAGNPAATAEPTAAEPTAAEPAAAEPAAAEPTAAEEAPPEPVGAGTE